MLLSSFAVFLVPFVSPGDPVRALLRARMDIGAADEATVQAYAQQFGLHDPMLVQFGRWLAGLPPAIWASPSSRHPGG